STRWSSYRAESKAKWPRVRFLPAAHRPAADRSSVVAVRLAGASFRWRRVRLAECRAVQGDSAPFHGDGSMPVHYLVQRLMPPFLLQWEGGHNNLPQRQQLRLPLAVCTPKENRFQFHWLVLRLVSIVQPARETQIRTGRWRS